MTHILLARLARYRKSPYGTLPRIPNNIYDIHRLLTYSVQLVRRASSSSTVDPSTKKSTEVLRAHKT
jgi:hypothetical protein